MTSSTDSASYMRAMVFREVGGEAMLEERPVPKPGPGEVLVRVSDVGIGVTNELARNGELGGMFPVVPGHELAATVVEKGPGVSNWTPDERVTASFYLLCGHCRWCRSGRETLCEAMGGYIGVHRDGAAADYTVLPAGNLVRIPDDVGSAEAGIVSDAVATGYHVVHQRLNVRSGQRVAVVGCGPLGLHAMQFVKAAGAIAIAVERDDERLRLTLERGLADRGVSAVNQTWHTDLRDAAVGRLDAVIDTVGSSYTLREALRALGRGGSLAVLGHTPDAELLADPVQVLLEEHVILGTRYATRAEIAKTLELVELGLIRPILGPSYPLGELNKALARARAGTFGRVRVVVDDEKGT
jgi:D-arabinose 1-dehydrogenase-like Zn-dependent alcohol dehydrogenase